MATDWKRRTSPDTSQRLRRSFQAAFLLLNLWIGLQFYWFVRQFETGAAATVARPAGVEGWLPIAGLMNTKYFLMTGDTPAIHPAAMFLFVTFLAISVAARKGFCSWLCPIGTLSEYLWRFGRDTFRRNFRLPRWLDLPLRSLKYILMGLFLYAAWSMTAAGIRAFLASPYGIVVDVQMLNFFRHLSVAAAVVIGVLLVGSVFVQNLWCRYLCPYGALMGLAALVSPLRIRRTPQACIDCAKCAKACPSQLAVDKLVQIRSAECIGCLSCVAACPAEGALQPVVASRPVSPAFIAATIAVLFLAITSYAKLTGNWEGSITGELYRRFVPQSQYFGHP